MRERKNVEISRRLISLPFTILVLHEDVEELERTIVKDLKQEARTFNERLMQSHRVKRRLDMMSEASRKLIRIYEDEDGARKDDIASLSATSANLEEFYSRISDIKDYYSHFPTHEVTEAAAEEVVEPRVDFTGEECNGRFLDLHEHYHRLLGSKLLSQLDKKAVVVASDGPSSHSLEYFEYVEKFATQLLSIDHSAKNTKQFRDYVEGLFGYLLSFYQRTQPLGQAFKQMLKTEEEVRAKWSRGEIPGSESRSSEAALDVSAFNSPDEIEAVGAEALKNALQRLGLKSGGTIKERASRLFLLKNQSIDQIDKKHFAKATSVTADLPPNGSKADEVRDQQSKPEPPLLKALILESKILKMSEILSQVIIDTRGRVEKKLASTYEELQAEHEDGELDVAPEDEDDEEEFIYNPLKLPLGWDGKPIPYWLYKLHGLNQEYKCEICGEFSYWGRRAFEKHFTEWRHQNGMRSLGIPNNRAFYEVTRIEDAQKLWKAMQDKQRGGFQAEAEEEFEDANGNVYSRKTYEDLRRQGLL